MRPARGAGKSALLVAEQFRFDEFAGNCRHVQRHELTARPWAVPVQRLCDQFLAAARGSVDKHRDIGVGEAADRPKHFLHGRRLADDLPVSGNGRLRLRLALVHMGNGAPHRIDSRVDVEGLGQIFERAALIGRNGAVEVGIRGHDDDRQVRVRLAQAP